MTSALVGLAIFTARLWWIGGTTKQMLADHIDEDRRNNEDLKDGLGSLRGDLKSLSDTQKQMHEENRTDRDRMHKENREDREEARRDAHQERIGIQNTVTTQTSRLGERIDGLVEVLLKKANG